MLIELIAMMSGAAVAPPSPNQLQDTITYHHEPGGLCWLLKGVGDGCADYLIILGADGQGTFELKGAREPGPITFSASRAQVLAFQRKLQSYRPRGEVLLTGGTLCRSLVTEGVTIDVRWQPGSGPAAHLRDYSGCGFPKSNEMYAALIDAPRLLPIADRLPHR